MKLASIAFVLSALIAQSPITASGEDALRTLIPSRNPATSQTSSIDRFGTSPVSYGSNLIATIQKHWEQLSGSFESKFSGRALVEFSLHDDGHVSGLTILTNTLDELSNLLCTRAVLDLAPFPPWPAEMRRTFNNDTWQIRFTFYYEGRAADDSKKPVISKSIAKQGPEGALEAAGPARTNSTPNQIEGAFGYKLGGVFDPASAIGKGAFTNGSLMYPVTVTNEYRSFSQFYVFVTPRSKRIVGIRGVAPVANSMTGTLEQSVVMEKLRHKYFDQSSGGIAYRWNRITQGTRSITTEVRSGPEFRLEINYYDSALALLAENESRDAKAAKANLSGH